MFSETLFKEQTGEDFKEFYKEYNNKLIYYINSICKDNEMAKDIATFSYIQAFENISTYDKNKAKFSTWLFSIARNYTINEIKSNKKHLTEDISLYDYCQEMETYKEEPLVYEKVQFIKDNIKELKYPYNIVMQMILIEKKSYKDVSVLFNDGNQDKNINTVKSWVKKGKSLLKEKLEKEFGKNKDKK